MQFELDGTAYSIDLSAAHAATLRTALDPFVRAANATRRTGRPNRRSTSATGPQRRKDNTTIREWARAAGYQVGHLGRIKKTVVQAYHRAAAGTDS